MKTLYLVRHAKSDWQHETLTDIDRPLNERGYKDAHLISLYLRSQHLKPGIIITSAAIRAMSTALIFARNLDYPAEKINVSTALYESGPAAYLDVIRKTSPEFAVVMLFG